VAQPSLTKRNHDRPGWRRADLGKIAVRFKELLGHSSLVMTMTEDRAQTRMHEVVSEESLVRN